MELFKTLEAKHGLPAGLLDAVWATESRRGKNLNNSSAGARGHFQFMPATAKQYGIYGQENDLTASATAAARMYSDLMRQSGGNLDKALAGYNWGSGNVQRKGMQNMPAETRNYIQKVRATMGAPEAPQRRGMPIIGMQGKQAPMRMQRVADDPYEAAWKDIRASRQQAAAPQAPQQSTQQAQETDPYEAAWRDIQANRKQAQPAQQQAKQPTQPASTPVQAGGYISEKPGFLENAFFGVVRGATDSLSPIASGVAKVADWFEGGTKNQDRYKQQITQERTDFDRRYGNSMAYTGGQIGGNILISAPVGAGIGGGVAKAGAAMGLPKLAALGSAIKTGGMAADGMTGVGGMAVRTIGGAINGAITGGMSADPDGAKLGAIIGAAMPGVTKVVGAVSNKVLKGARKIIGGVPPEVRDLALKAQQMGIDIPVDRLTSSKPLNAIASSLEYVPLSGRQGTMARMQSQTNRAVARTMGQDSDNLSMAFKTAKKELGNKYENYLRTYGVTVDDEIVGRLANIEKSAVRASGPSRESGVLRYIDEILDKAKNTGKVDGDLAYDLKMELDTLGKGKGLEAKNARALRDVILDGLEKAGGPEEGAAFRKLRQQYGNTLKLERLVPNGAEGDISLGKLANLRGARGELQDAADIAATFLKTREAPHGSLQRIMQIATGPVAAVGAAFNPWLVGSVVAGGRATNKALNSTALRNLVLNGAQMPRIQSGLLDPRLFYKMAPALAINHRPDPSHSSPSSRRK